MFPRSVPTREALVHYIPISKVTDMKSDVLQALMASLLKKTLNLVYGANFNIF